MDIAAPGSSSAVPLSFFVDRTDGALPTALVVSVPLAVYRVLMFAWAAWLAMMLLRWARQGIRAFSEGGVWRSAAASNLDEPLRSAPVAVPPEPAAEPPTPDEGPKDDESAP